jgi:hypothetical protein
MQRKDRLFPTIDDYYALQLRPVVSEPHQPRCWNGSGAERQSLLRFGLVDSVDDRTCKSSITRH